MRYTHRPELEVQAYFSEDRKYRYSLSVTKNIAKPGRSVCVIMQNPSDADERQADKSVQFLERLIFEKGNSLFSQVKQMTVVNQFAYVQKHGFDGCDHYIGSKNDQFIRSAIRDSDIILVAWGKNNPYKARKNTILQIIHQHPGKIVLQTKKHPSRGFYKDFVIPIVE